MFNVLPLFPYNLCIIDLLEVRLCPYYVGLKFERAELQMFIWMCGISMKDRRTSEELQKLVGVEPFTNVIRSGRL